jgi:hypothetical protein
MKNYLSTIFGEGQKPITIVQNPFKKECIQHIYLYASKWSSGTIEFEGKVKFQQGNTRGEQNFTANSFPELYMKIQQFCESL